MEIQKWEYKSYFDSWPHVEPLTFERALNSLGDDGWELVSVVLKDIEVGYFSKTCATTVRHRVYKRPKKNHRGQCPRRFSLDTAATTMSGDITDVMGLD